MKSLVYLFVASLLQCNTPYTDTSLALPLPLLFLPSSFPLRLLPSLLWCLISNLTGLANAGLAFPLHHWAGACFIRYIHKRCDRLLNPFLVIASEKSAVFILEEWLSRHPTSPSLICFNVPWLCPGLEGKEVKEEEEEEERGGERRREEERGGERRRRRRRRREEEEEEEEVKEEEEERGERREEEAACVALSCCCKQGRRGA